MGGGGGGGQSFGREIGDIFLFIQKFSFLVCLREFLFLYLEYLFEDKFVLRETFF